MPALALILIAAIGAGMVAFGITAQDSRAASPDPVAADAWATGRAVQAELQRRLGLLVALAASPALEQPSGFEALDAQARSIAAQLGAPVAIGDGGLAGLVDTTQPYGTPLPGLPTEPVTLDALESGRPMAGTASEAPILLAAPATRAGQVVGVVVSPVGRDVLEAVLSAGPVPGPGLAVALVDAAGKPRATVGAPGVDWPELRRGVEAAAPRPAALLASGNGGNVAAAASRLDLPAGWQVLAVRPAAAGHGMTVGAGQAMLAGGAGLVLLAFGGMVLLRRAAADGGAQPADPATLASLGAMRRLNDTIPVGLALLDHELRFVSVNARFASITGLPVAEHIRRPPREVLPPGIADALEDAARGVLATAQPAIELPVEAEAPGEVRNRRHFLASCHPAHDAGQHLAGVSVVLQDVTERVRAERTRELLVRELNHRVKNSLATVQSIVASTLRQSGEAGERLGVTLRARLQALARAHDLLTAREWGETELQEVVQAALAPWLQGTPPRILVDGPAGVSLRPGQAQAIVLALHELATNAVKYGALSVPEGRVGVVWESEPDHPVRLRWIETGGPPVQEPPAARRGFGSRLLERALAADLGAGSSVRLQFAPQGLRAVIAFPPRGSVVREAIEAEWEPVPAPGGIAPPPRRVAGL